MKPLALVLILLSVVSLTLAQAELEADPTVNHTWQGHSSNTQNSTIATDKQKAPLQVAAYVPEGGGNKQADRFQDRAHQGEFARPYMYVNPAFHEFYSNWYDNDGTQFYFYYQNDNSNTYNESPSNYNNEPDYSENFPGPEAQ